MFARARIAGGISVAHRASCGFKSPIETKLANASDIIAQAWIIANKFMSPLWGSGSDVATLTHSWRCGLLIFRWLRQLVDWIASDVCKSPHRGRHISSPQRELWGSRRKLKASSRSERHNWDARPDPPPRKASLCWRHRPMRSWHRRNVRVQAGHAPAPASRPVPSHSPGYRHRD